jgi:ribose-phosphate pyrophosphokinase
VREYTFALINKIRPKPGEVGEMNLIGEVSGKNVLIIDDILDSGGTSIKAANLLRQKGAKKVLFYATHGIFSCGTEELCKNFDAIMISNTHYHSPEKIKGVEVVDVSSVFAEAIYRAEKGLSISKLFE